MNIGNFRHGMHKHPLHNVWSKMKHRCSCTDISSFVYKYYAARGITVCDEWKDFLPFYEWSISNGWKKGLQLDRIDNNGAYAPENCRFVTSSTNLYNRNRYAKKNSSMYIGVYARNGKYRASVGKTKLGTFSTEFEAVTARNSFIVANNVPAKLQFIFPPIPD